MFLQDKVLAAGISPGLARAMADAVDTLTAAGTTQADAYELRNAINRFTTVASGAGAKLWRAGQPGDELLVYNAGANALLVYPDLGAAIDNNATNGSVSIPAGTQARFTRHNGTLWSMQSESAADISFAQSGTGALTTDLQTRGRAVFYAKEDFGVVADGVTDDTAAFQRAANAAVGHTLVLPSGTIEIATAGGIVQTGRVRYVGDGVSSTTIRRAFSPSSDSIGAINLGSACTGTSFQNLAIKSKTGTTGGCLISAVAVLGAGSDFVDLWNVYLSFETADTHKYALYLDGSARTGAPIGIRDWNLKSAHLFGGTGGTVYAKGIIDFCWHGGGAYPGGATTGKIIIAGDATVGSNCVDIDIALIDALDLDRCQSLNIKAGVLSNGIVNTANVTGANCFFGQTVGTIQANWVGSTVMASKIFSTDSLTIQALSAATGADLKLTSNGAGTNRVRFLGNAAFAIRDDVNGADRLSINSSGTVSVPASILARSATAIPAGGTAGSGLLVSSTSNFGVFFGSGAPTLAAAKGSLYLRSDGSGTTDRAYINTDGASTWTALTTVA